MRHGNSDGGLAHATWADDADESMFGEHLDQCVDRSFAPDDASESLG